ncbi:MAG: NCS2 family permease [Planctomycetota bacterium]
MDLLTRRFRLREAGTTVRTESLAGLTTFLTLSYILFVQPGVMAAAGIPIGTALFATCVASAIGCVLMGLLANYPIALAPAMGHNFFFAFVVCAPVATGGLGLTWQQGLAAVFLSGTLFMLLALVRFREMVIRAIPDSLKHAIAAGIGLLVAMLGLLWGGLVVDSKATLVQLGDLSSPVARLTLLGLAVVLLLVALRVRAALFLGILASLGAGLVSGVIQWPERWIETGFVHAPVLGQLDFSGLLSSPRALEALFVLFFLDVFDTVGTLVGVGARAGLLKDGELPRAGRALFADAAATVVGASLGTSTVTSYVESAAGVQAGGRTGLTTLVTALLFLLALPFAPLIEVVGKGVTAGGVTFYPVLVPTLIAVGALMVQSATKVEWNDPAVALPCFLTLVIIPFSLSITDGIAFGFLGFSLVSLLVRQSPRRHPLLHLIALLFLLRYLFLTGP